MYCENCGAKLDENAKFCQNCGNPARIGAGGNAYRSAHPRMRKEKLKNAIAIIVIIVAVAVIAAVAFFVITRNSSPEKKIIGSWELSEKSEDLDDDVFEVYPDSFTVEEDGDVILGIGGYEDITEETDISVDYAVDEDEIRIMVDASEYDSGSLTLIYTYGFNNSGKELSLRLTAFIINDDGDDEYCTGDDMESELGFTPPTVYYDKK